MFRLVSLLSLGANFKCSDMKAQEKSYLRRAIKLCSIVGVKKNVDYGDKLKIVKLINSVNY